MLCCNKMLLDLELAICIKRISDNLFEAFARKSEKHTLVQSECGKTFWTGKQMRIIAKKNFSVLIYVLL